MTQERASERIEFSGSIKVGRLPEVQVGFSGTEEEFRAMVGALLDAARQLREEQRRAA